MHSCISARLISPSKRSCGCGASFPPSGPRPTTSTRAPGKRSSASSKTPTPLSGVSRPTKSPALLFIRFVFRLPAPRAVLDARHALWPLGALRALLLGGERGHAHRLFDCRLFLRLRLGAALLLLARAAAAQAARGVEVSGGGCSGAHF